MPTLQELPLEQVRQVAEKIRFIALATVNAKVGPTIRTLGSWGLNGDRLYFGTSGQSCKVKHIDANPQISILLQQEGQEVPTFVNVVFSGIAKTLKTSEERDQAIAVIGKRSPNFRQRAERGEIAETYRLFELVPQTIKILDFSKGVGPAAVTVYQS